MKRRVSLLIAASLALVVLVPSCACADLGFYVDIASGYVLAAKNHGLDIPLEYEKIPYEPDPSKSCILIDRVTILYRPGDMQAESAVLLYMAIDDQEEQDGKAAYRAASFIEAVESAAPDAELKNMGFLFIMDIEQRITNALDEEEKLLNGEEILIHSGKNADYYLSFPDEGLVITAK